MPLKPKKVISITFTALILLLALPASAIMASWNSLPGDTLYPIKRSLEKASLSLLPSSFLEMKLRYTFLNQRTNEALATIQSANNTRSLDDIVTEAQAAKLALVNLESNTQTEATEQLIEKLAETNRELETVKQPAPTITPTTSIPTSQSQPPTIIYQPTTIQTLPQQPIITETPTAPTSTQITTSQPFTNNQPTPTNNSGVNTSKSTESLTDFTRRMPGQTTDQQIHQTQIQISQIIINLQQQQNNHQDKKDRQKKLEKYKQKRRYYDQDDDHDDDDDQDQEFDNDNHDDD